MDKNYVWILVYRTKDIEGWTTEDFLGVFTTRKLAREKRWDMLLRTDRLFKNKRNILITKIYLND